jgi:mannose-6-phosphate isomerase-like protein (cupin superfamily)
MIKTEYSRIDAYRTKDGSLIRELMHPAVHGNKTQSLAEAIVPPGFTTVLHRHGKTEELYHITEGTGELRLGDTALDLSLGDTVCIPPGTPHRICNNGSAPLKILCCCSPPYSHEDTELLE